MPCWRIQTRPVRSAPAHGHEDDYVWDLLRPQQTMRACPGDGTTFAHSWPGDASPLKVCTRHFKTELCCREEENRDAGDICSMRVPAAVAHSLPASAFAAAAAPATPKAAARGLKRGIKAIAAPCSSPVLVPPIQVGSPALPSACTSLPSSRTEHN